MYVLGLVLLFTPQTSNIRSPGAYLTFYMSLLQPNQAKGNTLGPCDMTAGDKEEHEIEWIVRHTSKGGQVEYHFKVA